MLTFPRKVRKRYERLKATIESKFGHFQLSLEEYFHIWMGPCRYCSDKLNEVGHCSVDLVVDGRTYSAETCAPMCPFCKSLKNSCQLSDKETAAVVQALIKVRQDEWEHECQSKRRVRL